MDTNKMRDTVREQFEAWHKRETAAFVAAGEIGAARHMQVFKETMLATWEASREAVVVELPKVVGFEGAYDSHRHHEFFPSMSDVEDADEIFGLCRRVEAKEAIEAQGLKVAP
jgi:hypothetical protein